MGTPLRIDPAQHFSCSQCGRCCQRFDVVVSAAEVEHYRRRNLATAFRGDGAEGTGQDPFELIPEMPHLQRIRMRANGSCGFLSADNRCRIHEELGPSHKPLTCRLFPYSFHAAADAVVVTASFACPTVVANDGAPSGSGPALIEIESLRKEWFSQPQAKAAPLEFVKGRAMDTRTARILRDSLLALLKRDADDIRDNVARIARVLDDLTRRQVLALTDADFAEYVSLTLPHAATARDPAPTPHRSRIGSLLQYGFVFLVASTRAVAERRSESRVTLRLLRLRMLAHFHGLAPAIERVNVSALKHGSVDLNAAEIRPIVFHYLRSTFETLGARGRPLLEEIAIACSYLNATCALAVMNAAAANTTVDRQLFSEALMEASDLAHAPNGPMVNWAVTRLAGGTEAVWHLTTLPTRRP